MSAANAIRERAISGMKRIESFLRNTTTCNRLNHYSMAEVDKYFKGDNHARILIFGYLSGKSNRHYYEWNDKKLKHCINNK